MNVFERFRRIFGSIDTQSSVFAEPGEANDAIALADPPEQRGGNELSELQSMQDIDSLQTSLQKEFLGAMGAIIEKHSKTLQIKRAQLSYTDDYGKVVDERFLLECDYFASNVMFTGITKPLLEFIMNPLSVADGRHLVLAWLEHHERATGNATPVFALHPGLTGTEYELYCLQELRASGWTASVTRATGDQGIDLIATIESITVVGQCKYYSNPVGNAAVQEAIAGREFQRADYAFVVTNSTFTSAAKSLAAAANVLLLHHSELSGLTTKLGIRLQHPRDTNLSHDAPSPTLPSDSCEVLDYQSSKPRLLEEILGTATRVMERKEELAYRALGTEEDPLFEEAVQIVREAKRATIHGLNARLKVGYHRSAKFIETMENRGMLSPLRSDGSRDSLD